MKKYAIFFITAALTLFANAQWSGYATPIVNGTGTWNDPYLIECSEHLAYVSQQVYTGATDYAGQYLKLTCDISMSNINWEPIGTSSHPFKGNFDGSGHTIDSMYVYTQIQDEYAPKYALGLFGYVEDGLIENTNLAVNVYVGIDGSGLPKRFCVGGVGGHINNTIIRYCTIEGTVNCGYGSQSRTTLVPSGTGGAVGIAENSMLQFITNRCDIHGATHGVGGIAGRLDTCEMFGCRNIGDVTGNKPTSQNQASMMKQDIYIGGIVGYCKNTNFIVQCYNSGEVSSTDFVTSAHISGIASGLANNTIEYCYNTGAVYTNYTNSYINNNKMNVYGIAQANISNCYNTGNVLTPTGYSYRFAVKAKSTSAPTYITGNCYYRNNCLGTSTYDTNQFGIPRDSLQMKTAAFVTLLNNGSNVFVEDVYNVNNGYPILRINMPTFTLTAIPNDEDYGQVTGGGTYMVGDTVTLLATANDGYHFVQWTDGNTQNPRTVVVTGDTTYIAMFAQDVFTVVVTPNDASMGTVTGGGTFSTGTTTTIFALANNGYHFVQWHDGNTQNPRTITVTCDAIYTAWFAQDGVEIYTITVLSEDETKGNVVGGGMYQIGEDVVIRAYPNSGYRFKKWNDENTDNPRVISVQGNRTYMAYFESINNGVEEVHNDIQCQLYPNPTKETATLVLDAVNELVHISLVDLYGHVLKTDEVNCANGCIHQIDVRGLAKGIYFVRINTSSQGVVRKLIVE